MSIVVLNVGQNFVALAGDGVWTDPFTGHVGGYISKLHLAPEYETLFGVTGSGGFGQLMMLYKHPKVRDFDDFVDDLPRLVRDTDQAMLGFGLAVEYTKSNVMVGGWSNSSQRYVGLRMTTYDKESTLSDTGQKKILKAFEPHFLPPEGGLVASTGVDKDVMKRFRIFDDEQQERDGPLNHMVRLVAGARATERVLTDEGYTGNIGGYIQLALYQHPTMTSSIVHRWPDDAIGDSVDPTRGEALPNYLMAQSDAPT